MENVAFLTNTKPDNDLIAGVQLGNRDAMQDLFVAHQRRVFSIALNYFGGDHSKADDVVQQVFLKLFTSMNFRGESALTTWLYRLTVNACIDESRKSRRWFGLTAWFSGDGEPSARFSLDDAIRIGELASEVQAAIATLKPNYRLPIVLKYVEELSYQQIADVLGCSIGTVSSRINRGHKLLAEKLGHLKGEIKG
jgi:RNA polymerase sigma-70 factor (ECF subfamily)